MAGNPQAPQPNPAQSNQQVPDHRLDEMQRRLRELETQNAQLRGQVDILAKPQQAPTQGDDPYKAFDPKVGDALKTVLTTEVQKLQETFRQQIGFLYDKADSLEFDTKYGSERFQKLRDRVEQIRQEQQLKGQWVSREQALQMAHFEATGKKPMPDQKKEEPAPAQQPVWDQYLQTYVDPTTGKPAQIPTLQTQPEPQPPQASQTPQVPPQNIPQAPPQAPPQNFQGVPGTVPGELNLSDQLPGQGVNAPAAPAPNQQGHMAVDLGSSEQDLDAWAEKYGDVPL
jgi:hypothetical protein